MYPHERSLVEEMQDKPFALIGVNSDKDLATANAAVADNKLNWRSFYAGGKQGPIPKAWAIQGWPTIVVLDAEFKIQYRGHSGEAATAVAKKLVAAMSAGK